jgi:TPR repeat protein
MGVPQDFAKANKLYLKAGELGHATAYNNLGIAYNDGRGVEVDKKKAIHYWELAAMSGDVYARHNLGCTEYEADNHPSSSNETFHTCGKGRGQEIFVLCESRVHEWYDYKR